MGQRTNIIFKDGVTIYSHWGSVLEDSGTLEGKEGAIEQTFIDLPYNPIVESFYKLKTKDIEKLNEIYSIDSKNKSRTCIFGEFINIDYKNYNISIDKEKFIQRFLEIKNLDFVKEKTKDNYFLCDRNKETKIWEVIPDEKLIQKINDYLSKWIESFLNVIEKPLELLAKREKEIMIELKKLDIDQLNNIDKNVFITPNVFYNQIYQENLYLEADNGNFIVVAQKENWKEDYSSYEIEAIGYENVKKLSKNFHSEMNKLNLLNVEQINIQDDFFIQEIITDSDDKYKFNYIESWRSDLEKANQRINNYIIQRLEELNNDEEQDDDLEL